VAVRATIELEVATGTYSYSFEQHERTRIALSNHFAPTRMLTSPTTSQQVRDAGALNVSANA
jgi:hypothetical protein